MFLLLVVVPQSLAIYFAEGHRYEVSLVLGFACAVQLVVAYLRATDGQL